MLFREYDGVSTLNVGPLSQFVGNLTAALDGALIMASLPQLLGTVVEVDFVVLEKLTSLNELLLDIVVRMAGHDRCEQEGSEERRNLHDALCESWLGGLVRA